MFGWAGLLNGFYHVLCLLSIMNPTKPYFRKLKLLSSVLLRVAGLSIDVLDGQRAPVLTYRLNQHELRRRQIVSRKESLLADLFTVIEHHCPAGKPQQRLQDIRRNLYNDRPVRDKDRLAVQPWLPDLLAHRLLAYVRDQQALTRYVNTTACLYRQQAVRCRRSFQAVVGDASFQRGLALSSLSLLRQTTTYRQTDPACFRRDDFQTENGLLRYLSRAATKTTPYSTLTHVATVPTGTGAGHPQQTDALRSHVRLSVRLLGVFDALLRVNRRLYEQWPVTVNPGAVVSGGYLRYIRQTDGQVACARLPVNPALNWVMSAGSLTGTYKTWSDRIRQRFHASGIQARQYIDKLIELGLLGCGSPVSAADPDWAVRLQEWLTRHRWLTPTFVETRLRLLDALLVTARMLPVATPAQRMLLLTKAHSLLAEHINKLAQPPACDFWPLRPEQLFFEDVTRPVQGPVPAADMNRLVDRTDCLIRHVASACAPATPPLTDLFRTAYSPTESVPLPVFFDYCLSRMDSLQEATLVPPAYQRQWEQWADRGLRQHTVHLRSEWIPDAPDTTGSQGVFWQSWTNQRGRLCAALNGSAGGFGRMYGRFLPYFSPSLTGEIADANRAASPGCLLVEATDDHYHNANLHPALLAGIILTPAGHVLPRPAQSIRLNELVVRLSDDQQRLDLWHKPTNRRVEVVDLGFQAVRSRLYAFLCQFAPPSAPGTGPLCTVINQWYAGQQPTGAGLTWPRIVLEGRLIVQRRTWWLPVGKGTSLMPDEDAFTFFRATYAWQQCYQLPDEVFISLPDAPAADDRKPQYIRFDNPLLVDLLRRLVRKAETGGWRFKVVEMRPASGELTRIDGRPYAVEAVPQWYSDEPAVSKPEPLSVRVSNRPTNLTNPALPV